MLFISRANSIGFAIIKTSGDLPSMNTRRSYEEKHGGFVSFIRYVQVWKDDDVVTTQVGSDSAVVPTIQVYQPEPAWEATVPVVVTASLVSSYTGNTDPADDRYYYEFDIDFADFVDKEIQIKVTQGTDIWLSEYCAGQDIDDDLDDGYLMRLDWSNADKATDYVNWEMDYTTGIQNYIYVEAVLRKYTPKGEDEVFSQITIKILIEAILERALVFETKALPKFLVEKIFIAGKHFYFLINNDQYITDKIPDTKTNGNNFIPLSWTVIDRTVLGYNSDNIGIEGSSMEPTLQRKNESVTSVWTFEVPKEYMLHEIFASHNLTSIADYTLDVGTTIGGSEIISSDMASVPLSGAQNPKPFGVHRHFSYTATTTIYVTITGAGAVADIRAQLILNN